jgi:hypothetical protein
LVGLQLARGFLESLRLLAVGLWRFGSGELFMVNSRLAPAATVAMRDSIALIALSKDVPAAADAFKECAQLGIPEVLCNLDREATAVAG